MMKMLNVIDKKLNEYAGKRTSASKPLTEITQDHLL